MDKLKLISLKDKPLFERYFRSRGGELSVYSFANIFIWSKLFEIRWCVINSEPCVFFADKSGWFSYLCPQKQEAREEVFNLLAKLNPNPEVARIENAHDEDLSGLIRGKFDTYLKSYEYVCLRKDLEFLSGNKFKSKRASYNYFVKNYCFEAVLYSSRLKADCLKLYDRWAKMRMRDNPDRIYGFMMQDSRIALKSALDNFSRLGLKGIAVKVRNKLKGFTLGFELNPQTFCVLYEITDLTVKGLAQFIFCEFCRRLERYKYINIMDDSGLENLKKVKLSYHPVRLIPSYIIKRKVGDV